MAEITTFNFSGSQTTGLPAKKNLLTRWRLKTNSEVFDKNSFISTENCSSEDDSVSSKLAPLAEYAYDQFEKHFCKPNYSMTSEDFIHSEYSLESERFSPVYMCQGVHYSRKRVCNKMCRSAADLRTHMIRQDNITTGKYTCPFCRKRFVQKSTLTVHERIHTGEKPFRCQFCFMYFSDSSTHKKHVRTHTGEKPYVCTDCNIGFTQSGNYHRHRKSSKCSIAARKSPGKE